MSAAACYKLRMCMDVVNGFMAPIYDNVETVDELAPKRLDGITLKLDDLVNYLKETNEEVITKLSTA